MNERPFPGTYTAANYREILSHRSMAEKLPNECVSIRPGFCEEQNPGRKTIDAMYDQCPLSLPFQFFRKQGPGGRSIGAPHRHSRKSGRLTDGHDGIVFVQHHKLP